MKQKQINQNWKEFELGEMCETSSGGTPSRSKKEYWDNGSIPWIKSGDLNKNRITKTSEFITDIGLKNSSAKYIEAETVLMAMYGATAGKVSISKIKATTNQAVCAIAPKNKDIDEEYLLHFLRSKYRFIVSLAFGGGQPNISQGVVRSLKILFPILPDGTPNLKKQKQIVAILEKAEGLKNKRKGLDELFDEYLKSVFYEMFLKGNFETEKLDNICEITSSKRIYQNEYISKGIPFYRSKEVIELGKGKDISIELFISNEKYSELKQKFGVPREGDLLITAVGTIGKTYVIPDDKEFYFKDGNLLWIKNIKNMSSVYLDYFLSNHFKKNKNDLSSGSAYSALTIVKLKQFKIPLPPLPLQKKFASIVEQVEKIKNKLKDEKKDADELFNALMQKAFSGELI